MHSPFRQRLTAALLAFGPFGILLVALLDSLVIPLPAGVDVLVGREGVPTVLEVNSMPAWSGLQKVSAPNIAEAIAADLMEELARRPGSPRVS